jgi:hypothetical protein
MLRETPLSLVKIIVAYEIADETARDHLREFLVKSLYAIRKAESVYEFVYSEKVMPWNVLIKRIEKMLKSKKDRVHVWFLSNTRKKTIGLVRTTIKL